MVRKIFLFLLIVGIAGLVVTTVVRARQAIDRSDAVIAHCDEFLAKYEGRGR